MITKTQSTAMAEFQIWVFIPEWYFEFFLTRTCVRSFFDFFLRSFRDIVCNFFGKLFQYFFSFRLRAMIKIFVSFFFFYLPFCCCRPSLGLHIMFPFVLHDRLSAHNGGSCFNLFRHFDFLHATMSYPGFHFLPGVLCIFLEISRLLYISCELKN